MFLRRFLPLLCLLLIIALARAQDDDPKTTKGLPMVDGLKALKHADPKVRYRAAQTLAELGSLARFAVPALREGLKDKQPIVRLKVAEALWKIEQSPAAVLMPVLLESMKHKDPGVRAAAPRVIAQMGTKAKNALPALEEALQDKDFGVQVAAITALGDLGPLAKEQTGALLDLTKDKEFLLLEPFVGAALSNLGDSAIPTLTRALADRSPDRRRLAAYTLGSMGSKAAPATAELAKALQFDDVSVRMVAARALGQIGPGAKLALPELEKSLGDRAPSVRIESALAIWFITGQAKHVAVLVQALSDPSANVRVNACQALAVMKASAKDAVEPIAKLLDDSELRIRAIVTLGEIGPPADKTLPSLMKLLHDKDGDMQLSAAFAVWQIGGGTKESLKVLEELLGSEKYYTPAIRVLGDMGAAARSMLPTLVNLYREEDVPADRQALAIAIKKIDPQAAQKLGIK